MTVRGPSDGTPGGLSNAPGGLSIVTPGAVSVSPEGLSPGSPGGTPVTPGGPSDGTLTASNESLHSAFTDDDSSCGEEDKENRSGNERTV